ncbi:MAG: deoxynucleoside kinase [Candidatus Babeliaceae bacterium]|nr:deoxynucleoside kinase [Candidatus Babeliaceae bacterium]
MIFDVNCKKRYFCLEGNMGVGKTTFLKCVGSRLNAQIVYEPVDSWRNINGVDLLGEFYADKARWGYTFQAYAFVTRLWAMEEHSKKNSHPIQLLERSVYADRHCFAQNLHELGCMSDLEWELYSSWYSWWYTHYTEKPAGFIYLRADPSVCFQRSKKRNRSSESSVQLSYLESLHEKHEKWLVQGIGVDESAAGVPVLILDCNKCFESDVVLQEQHAERVADFIFTHYGLPVGELLTDCSCTV